MLQKLKPISTQAHTFRIWLSLWLAVYIIILALGIIRPSSPLLTLIKVGSILSCFVYTLISSPQDHPLQLALLVTFLADIILAINNTSVLGILVFFTAQIIHSLRLHHFENKIPTVIFVLTAASSTFATTMIDHSLVIFTICTFYLFALISNLFASWNWHNQSPENPFAYCATLGFTLFLSCDMCTAISFFSLNHIFPFIFYDLANFFAWFFYYPSQVLLSNSPTRPTKINFRLNKAPNS